MTTIKTVPGIDNTKLTQVARSLIINADDPDNTKLLKAFSVIIDGVAATPVTLSFDEIEGLINIMDLQRPLKAKLDPSQWVIMTYQLNDLDALLVDGYRVTAYDMVLNADSKELLFSGVINHKSCIVEHPEYDASVTLPAKHFEFKLEDFDVIQQIAISRVMASRDSKFEPIAGTFDLNWSYSFSAKGVTFTTEGIDE